MVVVFSVLCGLMSVSLCRFRSGLYVKMLVVRVLLLVMVSGRVMVRLMLILVALLWCRLMMDLWLNGRILCAWVWRLIMLVLLRL